MRAFRQRSEQGRTLTAMLLYRRTRIAVLLIAALSAAPVHARAPSFPALVFSASLERSRDQLRAEAQPLPPEVISALQGHFDADLLATTRYVIGDPNASGLARFAIRNGRAAAVTLIDIIVLASPEYKDDLALWAHELAHVEQYRAWGKPRFAETYMLRWRDVEAEAEARARSVMESISLPSSAR